MLEIARWHFCAHSPLLLNFLPLDSLNMVSHDSKSIKRWLLIPFIIYARCLIEKYCYESLRLVNVSKLSLHKFIGIGHKSFGNCCVFFLQRRSIDKLGQHKKNSVDWQHQIVPDFSFVLLVFLFSSNRKIKCHLNNTTTYMHVAVINYTHFDAVWLCMFAFRNVKFEISIIGLCARYSFLLLLLVVCLIHSTRSLISVNVRHTICYEKLSNFSFHSWNGVAHFQWLAINISHRIVNPAMNKTEQWQDTLRAQLATTDIAGFALKL